MNWEYVQPVRIIFGNGQIKKLTSEIAKLNGTAWPHASCN